MASTSGQQSQIPQSAPPKSLPGSGKQPADSVYSNNSSTLERLFASFIVSFRRIGIFFPTITSFTTLVFFSYYGSLVQPLITLHWPDADGGFLILAEDFLSALVIALVYAFCIGVAAGFFGRLYAEANKESAANDYGLSQARLQAIPIISGIAAMGGIFVAAATLSPTNGSVDLIKIFTLNIQNILVALIFGFAPNLLIRNLQQGADRYVSDLESTRKKG